MYIDGVVFGLVNNAGRISEPRLAEKLRNFTIAWSRFGYHDVILENDSLDGLLHEALHLGYSHCLVQAYGHVIGETWIPKHWEQVDFQTALEQWINNHEFFVTGTILHSQQGWYGLAEDCLLVNLQHYAALGQPGFGQPLTTTTELTRPGVIMEPAPDDKRFHSLEPTQETESVMPQHAGWNFINSSLHSGLAVLNFSKALDGGRINLFDPSPRNMKVFAEYLDTELPDYSSSEPDPDLSCGQRQFLDSIDSQVKESRKGVFLFNLESYQDVVEHPDNFTPPVSSLYSVAAGFKPNMMLHSLGFDEATRMVFYDYSKTALEIRKFIVNEWDGEDFPGFVRHLMKKFPSGDVFYQLWANLGPDEIAWDDLQRLWLDEVEKWGGESVFREHWESYKNLQHEYILCNLFKDQTSLLAAIDKRPNAAIWWSNAFFTIYSNWLYTADERKEVYDNWLLKLAERNPGIFIYGSDYNNINVNHIRLGEYLERYQQECKSYLEPCKLFKHEMRL
ncbi:MAG: hypothetical protein WBO34_14700 [Gammaproteobacteria bacterium]